jgi:hypothetical protein
MKTFLIAILMFAGFAAVAPNAEARYYRGGRYYYGNRSYHGYYSSGYRYYPRRYYSRNYYRPYYYHSYYRPYYYSDYCYPGYYYGRPAISFSFGF